MDAEKIAVAFLKAQTQCNYRVVYRSQGRFIVKFIDNNENTTLYDFVNHTCTIYEIDKTQKHRKIKTITY